MEMFFRRKIYNELLDWKNSLTIKKKALIIKGLRQVGKTFIVKKFANENYENVIYIDFKNNPSLRKAFEGDLDVNSITLNITANIPNIKLIPNKTIFIFDEIQECSNARASLKAFAIDGRYDVVATGSLLGIKGYNRENCVGVPTGYEHIINMYAMDFEEFLWAKNINIDVINEIKKCYKNKIKISESINNAMFKYFKEYICIGGMPSVVRTFLDTNNMNEVISEQRDLIEEYRNDFGKHLDENGNEKTNRSLLTKINAVFNSIPTQLAKENKKFQYSLIEKKGRSSTYEDSIEWLCSFGLISKCYNLRLIDSPLAGNVIDDAFKIYMQDTGLFISLLEEGSSADILNDKLDIYKGAIYENVIADALIKNGKDLYYYSKNNELEIDFVTRVDNEIVILEVKAKTGHSKSVVKILSNESVYHVNKCIKLGNYNIGEANGIFTIPLYMAFLLK